MKKCELRHWFSTDPIGVYSYCDLEFNHEDKRHLDKEGRWWQVYSGTPSDEITDDERIVRINEYRYRQGRQDSIAGRPPTEANTAYQLGYIEAESKNKVGCASPYKASIYVASSWRNAYQPEVVQTLREKNYDVYDFRNPAPGDDGFKWQELDENWKSWTPDQFAKALMHPVANKGFKNDFDAMKRSDGCVLVLPSGNSSHLEAGWLAGKGKPVFVFSPEIKEPELMYKCFYDFNNTPRIYSKLDLVVRAMNDVFHAV